MSLPLTEGILRRANVPKPYWELTLEDYVANDDAFYITEDYLTHLDNNLSRGRGILYVGEPGQGKTMLANVVLTEALDQGYTGYYIPLAQYIRGLQRQIKLEKAWQNYNDEDAYREWQQRDDLATRITSVFPILVIDDAGKEHLTNSGFAQDEFDYLVRTRHSKGLSTIITTNVQIKNWEAQYSRAMASFIYEICEVVECNGKQDYRIRK